MQRTGLAIAIVLMILGPWTRMDAAGTSERRDAQRLLLATTTSTENSGLLEALLPPFEEKYNVVVDVIAVGTGQALEIGRSGDADVLMVHAPELETEFVADGYGVQRVHFMYNDFVVVGPPEDPADVSSAADATDAFARIAQKEATFISRGDNSGTHVKELGLWSAAGRGPSVGREPATDEWHREVGQGMGAVITLANEQRGYTLADRGTYLAYRGDVMIEILYEGDPKLFNPYSIIVVDPQRHPHVQAELAHALSDYVTSAHGQQIIDEYREAGEQLFFPDAE
ncbi:MAG: substrate-binding domain-containing protein [Alkalispirochaeta sp.]